MEIMMAGLEGAGQTTVLFSLKLTHALKPVPTNGQDVVITQYKNIDFTVRNIKPQTSMRALWRGRFTKARGIVFVVNSNNRSSLSDTGEAFFSAGELG
ncbi:hypothetical protein G7Y89_g8730 [Cudoniella acicularis]|uniref:Uncharacterized protein n=1 Tax=Cudoniella acicularis TaxID=354080 RepID=A0A8H4W3A3_9HELO|nr:hypothetical protein G7Y89_g8730 [Cudoniella acicularis]